MLTITEWAKLNNNPLESGVVSVCALEAGDAFNVLPQQVTMRGTMRASSSRSARVQPSKWSVSPARMPSRRCGSQKGPVGPKLRFWPTRRTLWEHILHD